MKKNYRTIHRFKLCLIILVATAVSSCNNTGRETNSIDIITGLVNQLENAVVSGNSKVWDSLMSPDAFMLGRDGIRYPREEVISQIKPPPAGRKFNITAENIECHVTNNAAFVSYMASEQLNIYGQDVDTKFPSIMYFENREGKWQLICFSYFEQPVDPAPVVVPSEYLQKYTGVYALAPDYKIVVETRNSVLIYHKLNDTSSTELYPIDTTGRFFRAGTETEFIFSTDSSGKQTCSQRRNWIDLVYTKE